MTTRPTCCSALRMRPLFAAAIAVASRIALSDASPEGWQSLFDGCTLDGWAVEGPPDAVRVVDGALTCAADASARLSYTGAAAHALGGAMEFAAEVMTRGGGAAAIAFGAGVGTQPRAVVTIDNSPGRRLDPAGARRLDKTGSVRGVGYVYRSTVLDDTWCVLRAEIAARHIRVWVDTVLVVDGPLPESPLDPAPPASRQPGGLVIEPYGTGTVWLRAVRIRPIVAAAAERSVSAAPQRDPRVAAMLARGFPVLNLHVHLKGGLTADAALARSRATGVGYGLAVNVGLGFPTTNDAAALAWIDTVRTHPVFVGLQAEGREWTALLSADAAARFDYIFTDAMTLTDRRGRRMRLWIQDEVVVEDPEEFMDMLVDRTVQILEREPIDIYANPTFLPASLSNEYDRLWTPARMCRVVDAAVRNGVAIEISGRLKLPRLPFLRMAREAGAKFTFGTNNSGANIGDIGYCLDMAEALNLSPDDMFVPCPGASSAAARRKPWPRPAAASADAPRVNPAP